MSGGCTSESSLLEDGGFMPAGSREETSSRSPLVRDLQLVWIIFLHSTYSPLVRYTEAVFDPDAHVPRPNRSLIYFGACLIAGMRLARERQVNVRVIPIGTAISESVDLACEIYNCVFRRVPREMRAKITADDVRVGMED